MAKRKRSSIGQRKPKITKKPSSKHYDTLDNETNCKSDSTNLCQISEASLPLMVFLDVYLQRLYGNL